MDNSRLDSKHRHGFHIFTLQLPTHGIPAGTFLVVMAMETTVAKSVPLGIHFSKATAGGCFGFGAKDILALCVVVLAHAVVAIGLLVVAGVPVLHGEVRLAEL